MNVQNVYGETPLYLAALFRHGLVLTRLLEHGARVAIAKEDGNTPLHVAAMWGQSDSVSRLCRYDGGQTLTARNRDGHTPLDLAKGRRSYLERRNVGNPTSTIRLLQERLTVHVYRR